MMPALWRPEWVEEFTAELSISMFRMVETQHTAATMQLVDSAQEQDLLEQMLETSKPPLPLQAQGLHYLLAAPFRYLPHTGSRFRNLNMPGIWYGADDPYCACAEIAYWRQRFLLDSVGLCKQQISSEHSMYEAFVAGCAIDLLSQPWLQAQSNWTDPSDYSETQKLGGLVRNSERVKWIRYASVRAATHTCAAVFDPRCLKMVTPENQYDHWHCLTTQDKVSFSNGRLRFDFNA